MSVIVGAHEGHLPGTPEYRRVVWSLFAAGTATFVLLYSTQSLLPDFTRHFGVSSESATLTISLTTLGLGCGLLIAGPLSDVVGRTRLIHLSLLASVLVGLASALAPTWTSLLVLRFASGFVLAGLPAVATAYLREELHPSSQARASGLYVGGTAFGGMFSRLLAGAGAEVGGWRWGIGATVALGLACAVVVRVWLPPSRGFVAVPGNPRALLAMTRNALTDRGLLMLYAIGGCVLGAMQAPFNIVGFRLTEAPFHLGLGLASLVFLVYPLGTISAAWFGRLADRHGRRAVVPVGAGIAAVGVLVTIPDHLVTLVIGLALVVIGFFAVHGIASGWVPMRAHAGGASASQAASLYLFTYYLGSAVFGTIAGLAWTHQQWPGVVALSLVLLAATAGLTILLRRTPSLVPGQS
ncbi:MFS transporter [Janibacter sp. Soil728]|uniref:MFS transporter n=1 Tax=Janibacter sp. Soil728 TaxID=1736393 RepID=UPI000A97EBA3|nr:MFS transporter [Janibacter sp. Soil728]